MSERVQAVGGLGAIIAVVVLILSILLAVIGKIELLSAALWAALALARLT